MEVYRLYGIYKQEGIMKYWVYFSGTRNGEYIDAENMLSAKWIFALKNNLHTLAYIQAHKVK